MTASANDTSAAVTPRNAVEDKVREHFEAARAAYSEKDYASAARFLEQVPEIQLTADMRMLLDVCRQYCNARVQFDSASRSYSHGEYALAVRLLEQIPEHVRDEACQQLLEQARREARVKPVIEAAQRSLVRFEFVEAIRILEEIGPDERTPRLNELLHDVQSRVRRLKELRDDFERKRTAAREQISAELCNEALLIVDQALELKPNDAHFRELRIEMQEFRRLIEERNALYGRALEQFENQDYQGASATLRTISSDLCTGECSELLEKADSCEREVAELTEALRAALRDRQFEGLGERLHRLIELQSRAASRLAAEFSEQDFEELLADLARKSADDPSLVPPLDLLVETLTAERIAGCESAASRAFLEFYPDAGTALPRKLLEILNGLIEQPELISRRLKVLRCGERLLGDQAARLDAWDDVLRILDELAALQQQPARWIDSVVENPRTSQLEGVGRLLAEAAAAALAGTPERSARFTRFVSRRLNRERWVIRKIVRKMEVYLDAAEWPSWPVTPITLKRAFMAAVIGVTGGLFGAAAHLLWGFLIKIGGPAGAGALLFLCGLWMVFCRQLSKLL